MIIKQLFSKIFRFRSNTAIHYQDLFLPDFRSNENLNNNSEYLQSAIEQVEHLEKLFLTFIDEKFFKVHFNVLIVLEFFK